MISRLLNFRKHIRYMSSRPEQQKLRRYLLENKEHKCIICQKNYPTYVLECAHLKPRCVCNHIERNDFNVVNWMCRNCHKIYDNGDIGVNDGILIKNDFIEDFDFEDKFMENEYLGGEKYYKYHILNIFKK